ncbi:MAG TPA: deoxyribose-phosphate aldolase [Cyclobacteriaceae bacterium]
MEIASKIEHTNLNPTITIQQVDQLAAEACEHKFFAICVPPFWVKRAKREIDKNAISLVTVVGFPFGYNLTETKIDEAKRAIDNGADEIDWVWNISSFKSNFPWTKIELAKASQFIHDQNKILKVIIETSYLSEEEIALACKMCEDSGADYVKTSTGFSDTGASIENILLIRKLLSIAVGIKASGGIKTSEQVIKLLQAGADRIGTSSSVRIIQQHNQST